MSQTAISIIGNEGSGKTIFVAALAHHLQDAPNGKTRLIPKNMATARYTAGIVDQVNSGVWPASTPSGKLESLDWDWVEPSGIKHPLRALDCAGQDFRQVFEATKDAKLSDHQQMLKQTLFSSRMVLLLVNLDEAIIAGGLSQSKRLEVELAPAFAVRHLKEAGGEVILLLAQSDKYCDLLASKKLPTPRDALQHYLPQLASTVVELSISAVFLSTIKTKISVTNGRSESIPCGLNTSVINDIAKLIEGALSGGSRKPLFHRDTGVAAIIGLIIGGIVGLLSGGAAGAIGLAIFSSMFFVLISLLLRMANAVICRLFKAIKST